jgi:hypothetical protein
VHVIADKPFAPNADDGRALVAAAAAASVVLNVFHNRRWDADIRCPQAVGFGVSGGGQPVVLGATRRRDRC